MARHGAGRGFGAAVAVLLATASPSLAQFTISGHLRLPPAPDPADAFPFCCVLGFATPAGPGYQSCGTRTWETQPGWYYMSGSTGARADQPCTMAFAGPGHCMRPAVLTNQFFENGVTLPFDVTPRADYAVMWHQGWDEAPANAYYQTFVARSNTITHVGFKAVHDGVDGAGPLGQHMLVSIHRQGSGTPDTWEPIGPAVPVLGVDAGGVKAFPFGAAWISGEVPVEPGKTYAVCIRPEKPGGSFQAFWRKDVYPGGDCYRVADRDTGYAGHDMWLYVAGDGDGLVIPYAKRVRREFHELTRFGRQWVQSYVARGRSLASIMLYMAVATEQPWLHRQRVVVRIRKGGPRGEVVGVEKIAIGQSTATAESGMLGVCFAPGEVPLEPGQMYGIEFEAFGDHKGFNPWMKNPRDPYEAGAAWFNGTEKMDYDLDLIAIEYEHAGHDWAYALEDRNFISNGDMEKGELDPADLDASQADHWATFAVDPGTALWYTTDDAGKSGNRYLKVLGGSINGKTVDGGYVQGVDGLDRGRTYRVTLDLRSTWPVDEKHQVLIGWDPTGQVDDPEADTITWAVRPKTYGAFEVFVGDPVRPEKDAVSVWLRARTTFTHKEPFEADFDNVALRQVCTTPPTR